MPAAVVPTLRSRLGGLDDSTLARLAVHAAIPMVPHPRQQEFLDLACEEALFGGAAGGGKSEGLLYWLAEGAHLPGYTGIIFRRTMPQLSESNEGVIEKARRMYDPLDGKYNANLHRFTFPSGAMISLGHLPNADSWRNYMGPSYHRIAFDELTQFPEAHYLELFGRIRRVVNYPIRLGMRGASNPGDIGASWVRKRFVTAEAEQFIRDIPFDQPTPYGTIFWATPSRAFVPSRIADNPTLDIEDYVQKLSHLPPVRRAQQMNGDWSVRADGILKPEQVRYYRMHGEYLVPLEQDRTTSLGTWDQREATWFATVDTAGTSEQRAKEAKGAEPSWSVMGVWCRPRNTPFLMLRDVFRGRVEFPDLCDAVRQLADLWKPGRQPLMIYIENGHCGPQLAQTLAKENRRVSLLSSHTKGRDGETAKVQRSADLQNKLAAGHLFLPLENNSWRPVLEDEWFGWTGHPDQPADQVDMCSYAAIVDAGIRGGWASVGYPPPVVLSPQGNSPTGLRRPATPSPVGQRGNEQVRRQINW